MKTICFFVYSLKTGGTEKVIVYLANYFSLQGRNVTLLTVSEGNDLKDIINPKIKIVCLNKEKISHAIPSLIRFIKTQRTDNFIVSVWPLTIVSAFIRFVSRETKILFIEHCNLSEEFKNHNFLFRILQTISINIFYRLAHEIITVSKGVKEDLVKRGLKKEKISVIYNPLNHLEGSKNPNDVKSIEPWLKFRGKKLISVGELKKQKNFPNLVKAIAIFKEKYSIEVKVLILGDGLEREGIEKEIKENFLEQVFYLPGWVDDPVPYLQYADLFILPSDYEGFGLVIAEALSKGITVVSTNCKSGPSEILKGGELGFLCKVNDSGDLAESINLALSNPIDSNKLIARSDDFSLQNIGKLYEEKLDKK